MKHKHLSYPNRVSNTIAYVFQVCKQTRNMSINYLGFQDTNQQCCVMFAAKGKYDSGHRLDAKAWLKRQLG